jgi:hypothetical protein
MRDRLSRALLNLLAQSVLPSGTISAVRKELDRLRRICDALVEGFEAHPETRRTDRCLIRLDNGEGATLEDRDERPSAHTVQPAKSEAGLWTARQVADHYAVTRDFIYAQTPTSSAGADSAPVRRCRSCRLLTWLRKESPGSSRDLRPRIAD